MKKIFMLIFVLLILASTQAPAAITKEDSTTITFTFDNMDVIDGWLEFDVMLQADTTGKRLGDSNIYINYNTLFFGSSVYSNSSIDVDKGTLLQGEISGLPKYSIANVADNTPSRVAITSTYDFDNTPSNGNLVPTNPTQFIHIKMKILDKTHAIGFYFSQPLMTGQTYESDNNTKFKVIATEVFNYLPPAPPKDVEISMYESNAVISWEPVDTTSIGQPITADGYFILYNEQPYEEDQFIVLDYTTTANYTHDFAEEDYEKMYYKITTYLDSGPGKVKNISKILQSQKKIFWSDIKNKIGY